MGPVNAGCHLVTWQESQPEDKADICGDWSASGVPRNAALSLVVLSSVLKNISFNVSTSLGGKFCDWQVKTANTRTGIEETHLRTDVAACTSRSPAELQSRSPTCDV